MSELVNNNEAYGLLTPKERLDSLNAIANIQLGNTLYSFKVWCHTADKLDKQGELFYSRKDVDNSYVAFMKFCNIVLEVLPKHPEFKELKKNNDPTLARVRSRALQVLEKLERLQKIIKGEPTVPWPDEELTDNVAPFRMKKGLSTIEPDQVNSSNNFGNNGFSQPISAPSSSSKSQTLPQYSSQSQTQPQTQSSQQKSDNRNPSSQARTQNQQSLYSQTPINSNSLYASSLPQPSPQSPVYFQSQPQTQTQNQSQPISAPSSSSKSQTLPQYSSQSQPQTQTQFQSQSQSQYYPDPPPYFQGDTAMPADEPTETEKESNESLTPIPGMLLDTAATAPKKSFFDGSLISKGLDFFFPKPEPPPITEEQKVANLRVKDLATVDDFVMLDHVSETQLQMEKAASSAAMVATIKKMQSRSDSQSRLTVDYPSLDHPSDYPSQQQQQQPPEFSPDQNGQNADPDLQNEPSNHNDLFSEHQTAESGHVNKMATVLYTFEPENAGDIRIEEGETVEVLKEVEANGWVYARNAHGQEGFVPANYLQF